MSARVGTPTAELERRVETDAHTDADLQELNARRAAARIDPPLTERQRAILDRGCEGLCIRGAWKWHFDGEPAGVAVKRLMRLKLADAIYFSGGRAAINSTEAGRAYLRATSPEAAGVPL